jgi:hypothetical protein
VFILSGWATASGRNAPSCLPCVLLGSLLVFAWASSLITSFLQVSYACSRPWAAMFRHHLEQRRRRRLLDGGAPASGRSGDDGGVPVVAWIFAINIPVSIAGLLVAGCSCAKTGDRAA